MKVYQVYLLYPHAFNIIVHAEEKVQQIIERMSREDDPFEFAPASSYHIRSLEQIDLSEIDNPHRMHYEDARVLLRDFEPDTPRVDFAYRLEGKLYVLFEKKEEALDLLKGGYANFAENYWTGLARDLLPLYQEGSVHAQIDAKYAGNRISLGSEREYDGHYYFSWHLKHGRLHPDNWDEYTKEFQALYEKAWDRYFTE